MSKGLIKNAPVKHNPFKMYIYINSLYIYMVLMWYALMLFLADIAHITYPYGSNICRFIVNGFIKEYG